MGIFGRIMSLAGDDPAEAGRLRAFRVYLIKEVVARSATGS